jgi:GTPase SAR1 family protein
MQSFQYFKKMIAQLFQGKIAPMQTLKITMLGSSGVGKTSLLSAIYDQFDQIIGQTNLQLTPDDNSTTILEHRLTELKSLVGNSIRARGGIQGTVSPRSFFFDLGKTGVSPSVQLHFQDYPGGYIESGATPEQLKFVESFIRESAAVLIAIDTPALMELDGQWHETINKPQIVRNLFKEAYQNLDSPRLVILVPVKCEKYVQNDRDASELLRRIREKYARLLDFFSADALIPNVAVVVTPVQTVGSVIFSRIEVKDDVPYFYFRKPDPDDSYQPRDSEQPLRYLLRFLLRLHIEKRRVPIINPILSFFGRDVALKEAVREFANGCKNTGGFSVLQGATLLRINDN